MILTIRTDKPEAEIGLFDGLTELAYEKWQAHRQLAETIHSQIATKLQFIGKELSDINGIVLYQGPGSYTGLRIGASVANALAYSSDCKVAATSGHDWKEQGIKALEQNQGQKIALPLYEAPAKTTKPRK